MASLRELYPDVEFDLDYMCENDDEEFIDESIDNVESEECEMADRKTENEKFDENVLPTDNATNGGDFVEWLETTARDDALSKKDEFRNIIMMDDENIEKFKKLYGVDRRNGRDAFLETLFSFYFIR